MNVRERRREWIEKVESKLEGREREWVKRERETSQHPTTQFECSALTIFSASSLLTGFSPPSPSFSLPPSFPFPLSSTFSSSFTSSLFPSSSFPLSHSPPFSFSDPSPSLSPSSFSSFSPNNPVKITPAVGKASPMRGIRERAASKDELEKRVGREGRGKREIVLEKSISFQCVKAYHHSSVYM